MGSSKRSGIGHVKGGSQPADPSIVQPINPILQNLKPQNSVIDLQSEDQRHSFILALFIEDTL